MVITNLNIGRNGRLGNQLFQAASVIGSAERSLVEFAFPAAWKTPFEAFRSPGTVEGGRTSWKVVSPPTLEALAHGTLQPPLINITEGPAAYRNIPSFLMQNLGSRYIMGDKKYQGEEEQVINLDGYFQSEKYFNHCRPLILALFEPKGRIQEYIAKNYSFLQDDEWTSLHVRRGDYVGLSQAHPLNPHPLQPLEYYHNAIEELGAKNILVFSDDISWCKENFTNLNCKFVEEREHLAQECDQGHPDFVKTSDENIASDYTEMNIMAACHNHIIANSSFSWWGAWLNDKEDKQVCAPLNWFSPQYAAQHKEKPLSYIYDLIPESWQII